MMDVHFLFLTMVATAQCMTFKQKTMDMDETYNDMPWTDLVVVDCNVTKDIIVIIPASCL